MSMLRSPIMKRALDVSVVLAAAPIALSIGAITAVAISICSPGPIFFEQIRIGKQGKPFKMLKFRSMHTNADKLKVMLSDDMAETKRFKKKYDPRIHIVGRFIRKFSVDELPQLINVLRGEMSIVGPRPPVPNEVELYNEQEIRRLDAQPGLTCLWQISGRSNLSFEEQVKLDLQYIAEQSIIKDIEIIIKTVPAVISGKGAY